MFYSYIISLNIILFVNSFILKFETSCNSSEFIDLENLIGSLHRYVPNYGHLYVRDMGLTSGQRKLLKRYENVHLISLKYKHKEHIQIINVKYEFSLINKTLSYRYNQRKYNYIDFIRKQFYLAIVIPFIEIQIKKLMNQLNLHKIYLPCQNSTNSVDLIFYYNLKQIPYQFNYHNKCFKHIRFLSADLSQEENTYPLGSAIMWKKLFVNERFSNVSLRYYGYTHFFLMEPDSRPIRPYWLDAIIEHIINGHNPESYISTKWWMVGSLYRGSESIGQNFLHINGNALYHLSSKFINFISDVFSEYNSAQENGYDLGLFLYLLKNIDQAKEYWHKFQFSDFIQNCWHTSCNETHKDFLNNYPNTYLIHGNKLVKKLVNNSSKIYYLVIVIIIFIIFLTFIFKRSRFFYRRLLHKRNFLLRIFLK